MDKKYARMYTRTYLLYIHQEYVRTHTYLALVVTILHDYTDIHFMNCLGLMGTQCVSMYKCMHGMYVHT